MKPKTIDRVNKILNESRERLVDAQKNGGPDPDSLMFRQQMDLVFLILERLDEIEERLDQKSE